MTVSIRFDDRQEWQDRAGKPTREEPAMHLLQRLIDAIRTSRRLYYLRLLEEN